MSESARGKLEELRELREKVHAGGGEERIAKIHESGRITARERIHLLVDEGSFQAALMRTRHGAALVALGRYADGRSELDASLEAVERHYSSVSRTPE